MLFATSRWVVVRVMSVQRCAVLCCAVLCCAALCCAVLCSAVLEDANRAQSANPDLQQPESINISLNTTPGSPDLSAHVAGPDLMQVCCNALYGPDQATASPDSHAHHVEDHVIAARQQRLDDIKENLTPLDGGPAACLWPHCADAAQDDAAANGASLEHGLLHCAKQYASSVHHVRSTCHSPGPLQPLPIGEICQSTLLPMPSSSAAAQALNYPLTLQPSQLLSHTAKESVQQPAADVCLFGSPPRQPHDGRRSFLGVPAVSASQHSDNSRGALRYMEDRQTLPDPNTPMLDPHAGHLHGTAQRSEEAVNRFVSDDVSSEKAFRQLLESAQQQRVSTA